ncbi:MAG: glycosyltransferase family 61 protein [Nitriliruptor sp.]|nr:MAG: glycosyltransferase family 61 protein [Nitriliruptor sp.]
MERQVFTGLTPYSGFVECSDIRLLQSSISHSSTPDLPRPENIYVSRQNTPRRALSNEQELEGALSSNGFKVVYAEKLSLQEQMRVFRRATSIVAPHGAGLANLIWSEQPCRVVEIFPHGMHNDCYARLAASLGFRYRPITCSPSPPAAGKISIPAVLEAAVS